MATYTIDRPAPCLAPGNRDAFYDSIVTTVMAATLIVTPVWLYVLFHWETDATGFVIVPVVAALNLLAIVAVTRNDAFLRRAMVAGLVLKIACAAAYWAACAYLWSFSVDSYGYMFKGQIFANQARTLGYLPIPHPWWGTGFLEMTTGLLIYAIGPSFAAAGVIYACAGFWGEYFAYRAFAVGVPHGDRKAAACFLFFFPSIAFWTAMVGKDALLCLAVGLIAYGFALISTRLNFVGLGVAVAGMAISMAVRPHVAALATVAATLVLAFSGNRRGVVGLFARLLVVPFAILVTIYVARNASEAWQISDTQQALHRIAYSENVTSYGGSAFQQSSSWTVRLAMAPFLMFRPFVWEVRSPQMAIAALESVWLLAMFWRRRESVVHTLRHARDIPVIAFAVVLTLEFAFTMAPGIGNFGLLVRQRVMVVPYTLFLLCMWQQRTPEESWQPPVI